MSRILIILLLSYSCAVFSAVMPTVNKAPKIRVLVGESFPEITVSGTDLARKVFQKNDLKSFDGRKEIRFTCRGPKRSATNVSQLLASLSSETGLLSLNGEKYHGDLLVLNSPGKEGCDVVNQLPLESYISSLLSKEMNGTWHVEALKAQAVAARTYALHKMEAQEVSRELGYEAYYDLESSEKHQVSGAFFDATSNTARASKETRGEILLTKDGKLNPTFYHAKCGGRTILPSQVWSQNIKGYEHRNCPICSKSTKDEWNTEVTLSKLKEFLKWANSKDHASGGETLDWDKSNIMLAPDRMGRDRLRVYMDDRVLVLEKSLMRKYFGRVMFRSNHFWLEQLADRLVVHGRGHGHGVGMCQVGALNLARQGWSYKRILEFYYPGFVLKKIY